MGEVLSIDRRDGNTARHHICNAGMTASLFPLFVEAALLKRMTLQEIAISFKVPLWVVERAAARLGPIPVHSPVALRNLSTAADLDLEREKNSRRRGHDGR